jgi:hypothetical protein
MANQPRGVCKLAEISPLHVETLFFFDYWGNFPHLPRETFKSFAHPMPGAGRSQKKKASGCDRKPSVPW